jgi:hypothetical protein
MAKCCKCGSSWLKDSFYEPCPKCEKEKADKMKVIK